MEKEPGVSLLAAPWYPGQDPEMKPGVVMGASGVIFFLPASVVP